MPIFDEMPVLIIRDLSEEEIKALHHYDHDEDDEAEPFVAESPKLELRDLVDDSNSAEDNEIVVEGDEPSASEGKTVPTDAHGYRLARGSGP